MCAILRVRTRARFLDLRPYLFLVAVISDSAQDTHIYFSTEWRVSRCHPPKPRGCNDDTAAAAIAAAAAAADDDGGDDDDDDDDDRHRQPRRQCSLPPIDHALTRYSSGGGVRREHDRGAHANRGARLETTCGVRRGGGGLEATAAGAADARDVERLGRLQARNTVQAAAYRTAATRNRFFFRTQKQTA